MAQNVPYTKGTMNRYQILVPVLLFMSLATLDAGERGKGRMLIHPYESIRRPLRIDHMTTYVNTNFEKSRSDIKAEHEWESIATHVNEPAVICQRVQSQVTYEPDTLDEWQDGKETWTRKSGDCEDFAVLIKELCETAGISAEVYVLYAVGEREGHAITIGKHEGRYWMACNGNYSEIESPNAARIKIASDFGWNPAQVVMRRAEAGESATAIGIKD